MSIDVTIRQKGFLKKTLPLEIILGDELGYGEYDGLRTDIGKLGETEFLAYNPHRMGRGFSVIWNREERSQVELRLLNPTSKEEIEDFFQCIERIADYWKCDIEIDGEPVKAGDLPEILENMIGFNQRVLRDMSQKVVDEGNPLTLFSVAFPIVLGKEEAQRFAREENTDGFRDYMHDKQSLDVYYPAPRFYRTDRGIMGIYCLSEDVRSIFPKKPTVPFGMKDPETNKGLKADLWKVFLYSGSMNAQVGEIAYDEMIERLPKEKVSEFDEEKILIENLTLDELKGMLR